jgi:elongation factor 1-alpha
MSQPSVNVSWFRGWKVTHKHGSANGTKPFKSLDYILSLTHPTDEPLHPPSWTLTKFVVLVLSPLTE